MAGLYIHIPFCKQACFYCDFHFSTNLSLKTKLVEALCKEIDLQRYYLKDEEISTIYFGGGTPSLLAEAELSELLDKVYSTFSVSTNAEITLEANPDDLNKAKLTELKKAGVNRLSIGIQSFDNKVLTFLNRAHNGSEAENCIQLAREIGFDNISIDLIYAIPERTDKLWIEDMEKALSYEPQHISTYSLTIEPNTVFGRRLSKGIFDEPSEETAARQFEIMTSVLKNSGFEQYEVSNFCLPGFESKHNSSYWRGAAYLGIGPSAHSFDQKNRQYNISHNKKYLDSILLESKIPAVLDKLGRAEHINDYLLTTLRTKWGADISYLVEQFGYNILESHSVYIDQLIAYNKAYIDDNHLILTEEGLLLADHISSSLFT